MWVYLGCAALVVLLSMSIECCRHSSAPTSHLTAARVGAPAAASFTVLASGSNLVGRLLYPQVRLSAVSPRIALKPVSVPTGCLPSDISSSHRACRRGPHPTRRGFRHSCIHPALTAHMMRWRDVSQHTDLPCSGEMLMTETQPPHQHAQPLQVFAPMASMQQPSQPHPTAPPVPMHAPTHAHTYAAAQPLYGSSSAGGAPASTNPFRPSGALLCVSRSRHTCCVLAVGGQLARH
jgi:hypothetical protein